jgi:hypothetical protein
MGTREGIIIHLSLFTFPFLWTSFLFLFYFFFPWEADSGDQSNGKKKLFKRPVISYPKLGKYYLSLFKLWLMLIFYIIFDYSSYLKCYF